MFSFQIEALQNHAAPAVYQKAMEILQMFGVELEGLDDEDAQIPDAGMGAQGFQFQF